MTSVSRAKFSAIHLLGLALLILGTLGPMGCKAKPSEKDCKDAINNVRRINKQDSSDMGADPVAMIRSCRGSSSQKSVDCMIAADSEEDLRACEGESGEEYFNKEREAAEKRLKESGGGAEPEDAASTVAAPADAAPTEATPSDAAPTDATPPTEAAPAKAAPTEAAPAKAAPAKAAPAKAAPAKAAPAKAAPPAVTPPKAPTTATP
jgi:hypothetical protein